MLLERVSLIGSMAGKYTLLPRRAVSCITELFLRFRGGRIPTAASSFRECLRLLLFGMMTFILDAKNAWTKRDAGGIGIDRAETLAIVAISIDRGE